MGPIWGRQHPCGPMLAPGTLLSGVACKCTACVCVTDDLLQKKTQSHNLRNRIKSLTLNLVYPTQIRLSAKIR